MEIITALFGAIKALVELVIKAFSWKSARKKARTEEEQLKDGADLLARFLSVFATREIPRPLIPKFLAAQHLLTVQQACSNELLLAALDDPLIEHTAQRLAVSTEWLYGTSSMPYQRFSNYKNPQGALDLLESLLRRSPSREYALDELVVVTNERMEPEPHENARAVVLLCCQLDKVEGKDVEQIFVVEDDLPWYHAPARQYAKQLVLLAMVLGVPIRGKCVGQKNFSAFERGELFPHQLLSMNKGLWHPDDYVVTPAESVVAKDTDEAIAIRQTLVSENLLAKAAATRVALGRHDLYERHVALSTRGPLHGLT
ncbi:MAG: hypothetical protein HYX47_05720 [Burkholderiales bacterium]|nr:hypothetical protein [Burkholderiales bacterium]